MIVNKDPPSQKEKKRKEKKRKEKLMQISMWKAWCNIKDEGSSEINLAPNLPGSVNASNGTHVSDMNPIN